MKVIAVEMDLEGLVPDLKPVFICSLISAETGRLAEGREPVDQRDRSR
jgi:hypothetical protein